MANMDTRSLIVQAQQAIYAEMRMEFEAMGMGGRHCHNLSYESRNDSRHGRFAHMGHFLTLDKQMEKLRDVMRRLAAPSVPVRCEVILAFLP